jgi:hypothetical protein
MTTAELLRARFASAEAIEAALVEQLTDATEALAGLRAHRPEVPTPAWTRHYAQNQALFHRALVDLQALRKSLPAQAAAAELESTQTPSPSARATDTAAPVASRPAQAPPTLPAPRNRLDRRRLEALKRATPDRRKQMMSDLFHRPSPSVPCAPAQIQAQAAPEPARLE